MAGHSLLDPSKLALGVDNTHFTLGTQARQAKIIVVRDEELLSGRLLEALQATPCHVLDGHESAVVQKHIVEFAVHDDGAVERVDEAGDHVPRGLRGGVLVQDAVAALSPFANRRIDSLLHCSAVEVDCIHARRKIVEAAREAKDVPEKRTSRSNCIKIEAGIGQKNGLKDVVPERAALHRGIRGRRRKRPNRREGEILLHVGSVATLIIALVNFVHETLVEVEEA